jgi:hypothetical protein
VLLVKTLKTCEGNLQELNNFTKRTNLRIMDIKEGEEVQGKEIHNILNKIKIENFLNLEKTMAIQVHTALRTPKRLDQNRTTP